MSKLKIMENQTPTKEELSNELQELKCKYEALQTAYQQEISERKESEAKLNEINEHLITLIEAIPDAIFFKDGEGRLLITNEPAKKLFRLHDVEWIGKTDIQLGNERPELRAAFNACVESDKKAWNFKDLFIDYEIVNDEQGMPHYFEVRKFPLFTPDGNRKALVIIGSDITLRKQTEKALIAAKEKVEESEKKYKQIFDNTFDIIFIYEVTEDNRFKVLTFNPSEEKLIGSIENYRNRYIDECIPADLYQQLKANYERCIREEKNIVYDEVISFQDFVLTFHTQLIPLKNSEGRIHRIIGISRDITANKLLTNQLIEQNKKLKQLNTELILAKEKAEESDRLKSSFLQNMSHEVRTPLNSIVGFAQLIADSVSLPTVKIKKYSDTITANSDRLIGIITDVIEISQIQSNQLKAQLSEFELNTFIKQISKHFKAKAEEKCLDFSVKIDVPASQYCIVSDMDKLERIMNHLIDNAIKFTTRGFIKILCESVQQQIKISVTDSGIGISEEMQKIIFDPFRQVETGTCRNYGGNGLGLSIIKAYTELLNGSVSVSSAINQGSVFTITIPENKDLVRKKWEVVKRKKITINTILVVEDEYSNYLFLLELLANTELKILYVANGQQALDFCKSNNYIDLIFMDIKMPIMDGHTAAKLIKEIQPDLPIIALSAFALENEKEHFIDIFDDYITKPINVNELKKKLLQFME